MGKTKLVKRTRKRRQWVILAVAGFVAAGVGVAFMRWSDGGLLPGSRHERAPGDRYETVRPGQLPSFAKENPEVEEAYRYAAANPEVLQYVPCFCGCGNIGHRHNGDCYVQERYEDGRITFTSHAAT